MTIDADLMDAADLLEGEQVTIVDIDNGARLVTYAITGERGSGVIGINGAAAHLVHPGDLVILIAYGTMEDAEARRYQPRVVFVDADNKQIDLGSRSRLCAGRRGRADVAAVSLCCSPSTSATPTPSSDWCRVPAITQKWCTTGGFAPNPR